MDKWLKLKNYLKLRKSRIWSTSIQESDSFTFEEARILDHYIDQVLNKMDEIEKEGKDG